MRGQANRQPTYAALRLGFAGGRTGVRLGTTFISKRAPSASAARDTESIVMVGLAGSSKEWTAIRLVPMRRGGQAAQGPNRFTQP